MIDTPEFTARLDAALAMNGLDNAAFANALNSHTGQQLVNGWRRRGKIGSSSVPRVMSLLPRTSMDWLQYGRGRPERFTPDAAPTLQIVDSGPSRATRLDLNMLASALVLLEAEEEAGGKYRALDAATRLMGYYERLARGEGEADLMSQIFNDRRDNRGSRDASSQEDPAGHPRGRPGRPGRRG